MEGVIRPPTYPASESPPNLDVLLTPDVESRDGSPEIRIPLRDVHECGEGRGSVRRGNSSTDQQLPALGLSAAYRVEFKEGRGEGRARSKDLLWTHGGLLSPTNYITKLTTLLH